MNITKRTKSEETTVYQFRVFLSQSADGKQRTRSKTWQAARRDDRKGR